MKYIIEKLIKQQKTISVMESCTGGLIASSITNIEGSSQVFSFGAVTYHNNYKIKLGVSKDIIDNYTVYSEETAIAMAKAISEYTESDIGVGVTGKLNAPDPANQYGEDNIVYIAIYDQGVSHTEKIHLQFLLREEAKIHVLETVIQMLEKIIY